MNFLYTSRKRSARVLCLTFNLNFSLELLYICSSEKINTLFTSLGSVRIEKNCALGHERTDLSLRPRFVHSRPMAQFFSIRSSQPVNNVYVLGRI